MGPDDATHVGGLPIVVDAAALPPLGMEPAFFLRDYWQKRPLLIRNAFPGMASPLQPEDLAGLACEDGVLARLIQRDPAADTWSVRQGPFVETDFPGLPDHDWTLLVQDVDKWDADVAALLPHFSFLPSWRLDDVMVSFAATDGSVGAHVDQYDVFLLQGLGRRHWQVDAGPNPPTAFRDDVELKLLRDFTPTHDWVLEPGDMLYLPPGVPHHGVALDPCLTFSVGMRAPSTAELASDYIDHVLADADDADRYTDADLAHPADPHEIGDDAMDRVAAALKRLKLDDTAQLSDWFGRFITTYRVASEPAPGGPPRSRIEVEWDLQHGSALHRHPYTRMAWRGDGNQATLFCSGLAFRMPVADARTIAAAPVLEGAAYAQLGDAGRDAVLALLEGGHYQVSSDDDDDEDDEGDAG